MSHKPYAGVLPPGAAAKVDFTTTLTDTEQPMVLTVSGTNAVAFALSEDRSYITLTNQTQKHAPFVLLVIPQNPGLNILFDLLRKRMGG